MAGAPLSYQNVRLNNGRCTAQLSTCEDQNNINCASHCSAKGGEVQTSHPWMHWTRYCRGLDESSIEVLGTSDVLS